MNTRRRSGPQVRIVWSGGVRKPRGCSAQLVRAAAEAARVVGGRAAPQGALSIVFVGDAELAQMHGEWLDDPSATDVITFDLRGEGELDGPEGELYISAERASAVAARRKLDPLRELLLYVVHGVLHLAGHDDHEPRARRRMRIAERRALALLALPAPRGLRSS